MTTLNDQTTLQRSQAAATTRSVPPGGRLVGLGDSICRAGDTIGVSRYDSYNAWAAVLSGGKVQFVRNAGVGGNTLPMMMGRFDTDVTPYEPNIVSVDGGANDFTFGYTDAQFRANIISLAVKIRSIGATPLFITPGPVSTASAAQKQQIARNGAWMIDYCNANSIPVVDMLSVCVDPTTDGNFNTALTKDTGTHPNNTGHYKIGQAMANAIPASLQARSTVARYTSDPMNLVANGLFLASTGGIGNSWSQNWGPSTGTVAFSIVTDTNVPGGSMQRISLSAATGQAQLHQSVSAGWSVGDKLRLSGIVTCTGVQVGLNAVFTGASGNNYSIYQLAGGDFTRGELVNDFTIPAGTTAVDVTLWVGDRGNGAVTGTGDYAAVTLRNMTAGGLITAF